MKKVTVKKIARRLKRMVNSFKDFFSCIDLDEYLYEDEDEDEDEYYEFDEDEEYEEGINKYHITFDLEVPAEQAEDSIDEIRRSFFAKMEKAFSLYDVSVDNLDIYTEREFDPEDLEDEYEDMSFKDIVAYFKSKKTAAQKTEDIPIIDLEQTKTERSAFTVIAGGKNTVNF